MQYDILLKVDHGNCVGLVLLDLREAFDTLDHVVLLECLEWHVELNEVALCWLCSNLEARTFTVKIRNHNSSSAPIIYGVTQSSILGSLFSLYMLLFCPI